ncbi:Cyclophilin-type peptidyl-prolyl cis-trans isomerase domain [Dillenia turbinata]|uniref:Cyclophilin-type peptidyl-prolyl cis-trans isomerase domain n=1 Tax=Dillenia turbinata TaxID=194707 RepID=A0AAN8USU8_9MAGN
MDVSILYKVDLLNTQARLFFTRTSATSSARSLAIKSRKPLSGNHDSTIFRRNVKGFVIQGGDPTGTGKGETSKLGKKFNDEIR